MNGRPTFGARLAVALSLGFIAGTYCHFTISLGRPADDFSWFWLAARALINGQDPYVVVQPGGAFNLNAPFLYPLTSAILAVPFCAWLSPAWAATVVVAFGAVLPRWRTARRG